MDNQDDGQNQAEPLPSDPQPDPDDTSSDGQMHDSAPAWQQLPPADRAVYMTAEALAGGWLSLMRRDSHGRIDDSLLDLLACVRAVRHEDMSEMAAILRSGNLMEIVICSAKLIAELLDDAALLAGGDISDEFFSIWSSYAIERGS